MFAYQVEVESTMTLVSVAVGAEGELGFRAEHFSFPHIYRHNLVAFTTAATAVNATALNVSA
jgi:hypothetical protein